jgi:hypothetical protein
MEFFIRKGATLPLLKMQVVNDGRTSFDEFMTTLETASIFFSMVNTENGVTKISSVPARIVEKINMDPNAKPEYYVYYRFRSVDTNRAGRFEGEFLIQTEIGTLITPIRDRLFINITDFS